MSDVETKNKNRRLREIFDDLDQRLDEADDELRPELPESEYGIGELSAVTLVKLTVAKAAAILDCLDETRGSDDHRKVQVVAANEVTALVTQFADAAADDDELTEALGSAEINGPVI